MKLTADIIGSPPPETNWFKDGTPVDKTDTRIVAKTEETEASLTIRDVSKRDEGDYALVLKNEFGENTAEFKVAIKDVPGPPQNLVPLEVYSDRVVLQWQPPEEDGGSPVIAYVVEKRDLSRKKWTVASTIEQTTLTISDLLENTLYSFKVSAINDIGTGPSCELPEPVVAKNPFTVPKKPGEPEVSNMRKNSCTLTWTAPESDGGAPIIGYVIERKERLSMRWAPIVHEPVPELTFKVEELFEGTDYEFRIIAMNKAGASEPSFPSRPVTAKEPFTVPSQPQPPNVDDVANDMVTLSWSPPDSDGGAPISHYLLEYKMKDTFKWIPVDQDVEGTMYSISGLVPGQDYVFRVSAVNPAGPSKPSEPSFSVTIKQPVVGSLPEILEPLEHLVVGFETDATFTCKIHAVPEPEVKWYKNGKELTKARYEPTVTETHASLTIRSCDEDDQGQYECVVTNNFGSARTSASLTVEGNIYIYILIAEGAHCQIITKSEYQINRI